ncbi:MAG: arylsulfatase [Planctomycetes bacterium]|nr:arylsulfatase [Planctomycetota bacterium]
MNRLMPRMPRRPRLILAGLFLIARLVSTAAQSRGAEDRPNVILIMTDDQGYGELACHGNPVVRTPNLDRLYAESIRFSDFHVAPMCTPTRGQLLTGVDCLRNGAMNVSSGRTLLRREFPTIADMLRSAGYATAQFGKWHLGDNYPYRPRDRGFDESVWYGSSHIGSASDAWLNDYFDDVYWHGDKRQSYAGYTTDVFFREAMTWIGARRDRKQPFFVYLATAAAHGPHYVPEAYRKAVRARLESALARLPSIGPKVREQLERYLAMVENIDENLGRLDAFLAAEGLRDNTILVFLTDNGSTMGPSYFNAGMTGGKVTLWEGGHRVPCFVRWPAGGFGAPRDESELVQVQDLLPTLGDLCGVGPMPPVDGVSLAPLLRGRATSLPDRMLVIHYSRMPVPRREAEVVPTIEGAAVLWKRWRWIENRKLYDLAADPLQQRDVAPEHPEVAARMREHLERWWERVRDRVNEPQRIVIGSDAANPLMLSACDWWDVFIDQQAQVRRGDRKNGDWQVEVDRAGVYEIELRRWPREADLALRAAAPAVELADGMLPEGAAIPIAKAKLVIAAWETTLDLDADSKHASFLIRLEPGPATIHSEFLDADGASLLGAYYAYVRRVE